MKLLISGVLWVEDCILSLLHIHSTVTFGFLWSIVAGFCAFRSGGMTFLQICRADRDSLMLTVQRRKTSVVPVCPCLAGILGVSSYASVWYVPTV